MAFDLGPYIVSVTAAIISFISLGYTYYQNRRKMEADLWIDNKKVPIVTFCGFNHSYRSVALIDYKFLANGEPINLVDGSHKVDPTKFKGTTSFNIGFHKKIELPHILGEGEAIFLSIPIVQIATFLHYNDFSGVVKFSGYFKTADKKIYKSKSTIELDIEKYRIK